VINPHSSHTPPAHPPPPPSPGEQLPERGEVRGRERGGAGVDPAQACRRQDKNRGGPEENRQVEEKEAVKVMMLGGESWSIITNCHCSTTRPRREREKCQAAASGAAVLARSWHRLVVWTTREMSVPRPVRHRW
jgi:hypothetical protein